MSEACQTHSCVTDACQTHIRLVHEVNSSGHLIATSAFATSAAGQAPNYTHRSGYCPKETDIQLLLMWMPALVATFLLASAWFVTNAAAI